MNHDAATQIGVDRHSVGASWFVWVLVAGGLIALLQVALGVERLPIQLFAGAFLAVLGLFGLIAGMRNPLPSQLRWALFMFTTAYVSSTLIAAAVSDAPDLMQSFVFMYGIGGLLALDVFVPFTVRASGLFKVFCFLAVAFGLVQVAAQDLLVPELYRARFGIVFDEFVNGRIRVSGFFASPPRFAELLVFVSLYLQYEILIVRRGRPILLVGYLLTVFVLVNTYSRSGYVLWIASFMIQLLLLRRWRLGRLSTSRPLVAFVLALLGAAVVLIVGLVPMGIAESVTDATSLDARFAHWGGLQHELSQEGVLGILFGTGRSAHFSFLESGYFVVDNVYLATLLYGGLAGVVCLLVLVRAIVRDCGMVRARLDGGWAPLLAFYLALLVEGLFVDNHNTLFVTSFAAVGMLVDAHNRHGSDSRGDVPLMKRNPADPKGATCKE